MTLDAEICISRAGLAPNFEFWTPVGTSSLSNNYNYFSKYCKMNETVVLDAKDVDATRKSALVLPITIEFT